ncbi:hypothetical protein, partial [Klebsiella pneumoniae]|uniref:hypothetical protein n=1 Tax=Klebsiella pneumoniae TaxID=573 RepID=UPI00358E8408
STERKNICQPRVLYPVKYLFRNNREEFCFHKDGIDMLFLIPPTKYNEKPKHYIQNKCKMTLKGGTPAGDLGPQGMTWW